MDEGNAAVLEEEEEEGAVGEEGLTNMERQQL